MAVPIKVKVNSTGLIQTSTTAGVTLRNTFAGGKSRLDELLDVELSQQTDGSVPVYNSTLDKYEVKPINDSITNLDGGSF